jgi:lantibiotic modifying enzyme
MADKKEEMKIALDLGIKALDEIEERLRPAKNSDLAKQINLIRESFKKIQEKADLQVHDTTEMQAMRTSQFPVWIDPVAEYLSTNDEDFSEDDTTGESSERCITIDSESVE